MNKLCDLEVGKTAFIKKISVDSIIKRRLLDIGLIPNTKINCLYNSPFKGIKAYLVRGSVIAIRDLDATKIEVDNNGC